MAQIQSKASFLIDIRQTPEYGHFMEKIGWQVVLLAKDCQMFVKKLPLVPFSIAKILRYYPPLQLNKVIQILRKYHVLFIKLYSFSIQKLEIGNWKFDFHPLIPTKTIWINLEKKECQLLKEMKSKTRYNLRLSQRKNIKIKIIAGNTITKKELLNFYHLWSKNKPFNWLFKPSFNELATLVESFGKKCFFVLTWNLELGTWNLIAGVLILQSSNMAFYWHNCSNKQSKKIFAPTLCVWESIKESKKRKLQVFDMEGIWDERFPKLNKGWQGFSRFKKGFGGKEIIFPQPLIINLFNLLPRRT